MTLKKTTLRLSCLTYLAISCAQTACVREYDQPLYRLDALIETIVKETNKVKSLRIREQLLLSCYTEALDKTFELAELYQCTLTMAVLKELLKNSPST